MKEKGAKGNLTTAISLNNFPYNQVITIKTTTYGILPLNFRLANSMLY
jgi:hypothetical protein